MFVKRLFESNNAAAVQKPLVDHDRVRPVFPDATDEFYEQQASLQFGRMQADHQTDHGAEQQIRPVPRRNEPALKVKAVWGDFVEDPKWAARKCALECLDELDAKRSRVASQAKH